MYQYITMGARYWKPAAFLATAEQPQRQPGEAKLLGRLASQALGCATLHSNRAHLGAVAVKTITFILQELGYFEREAGGLLVSKI